MQQLRKIKPLIVGLLIISFLFRGGFSGPVLYYPMIVSFFVFLGFFLSLFSKKCLIQKFAEKQEANLPPHAIRYCYNLNIVWTVFLAINTVIAFLSTKDTKLWSLYNGLISYLLIATLFACEYAFRKYYRKRFG